MKTKNKVNVNFQLVEFIPNDEDMQFAVLYISEKYKTIAHKCLCGCGNLSITPVGNIKPKWNYNVNNEKLTMTPSVLNKNCPQNAHYIITNGIANIV